MEADELIKKLQEEGYLITPDALRTIKESDNPDELIHGVLQSLGEELIIDAKHLEKKEKSKITSIKKEVVVENVAFKPLAKEYDADVKLLGNDVSDNSGSLGTLDDFIDYFKDRYNKISDMLRSRGHNSWVKISGLKHKQRENVKIIGIVNDKRATKNGHIFIVLEDLTGTANVLIPKSNRELIEFGGDIVNDEVIAINGRMSKELFIADEIFQPDVVMKDFHRTEEDIAIALMSDMHIGSKLFLKKNFEQFIDWINGRRGNEKQRELAGKVKYITFAGDVVDGIGIYPGQENELAVTDIFEQYNILSDYLEQIPDHIHMILSPGNHDAVKTADPQPRLPKELVPELYKMDNITMVGSPSLVSLHGVKTLVYHGNSFIDFVNSVPGSKFDNVSKIMVDMLKRRHLHPSYGGRPITPEKEDFLTITDVPDIFHCGEAHCNSYDRYKGTICICSGTWQSLTDYQIKQGHKATPAVLPIIETKREKINVIHFDKGI